MDEADQPHSSHEELHRMFLAPTAQDFNEDSSDDEFRVGNYWYQVTWGPALMPVWLTDPFDSALGAPAAILFLLPLTMLLWKIDPRARSSVRRRKQGRPFARLVAVEFLASDKVAEDRQREIRMNWKFDDYVDAIPVTAKQVREAYRRARKSIARPSRT